MNQKFIYYFLALLPSVTRAAEGVVLPDEASLGLTSIALQAGLGGVVAVVAVKMLLVLYADKEKNAINYHDKLLSIIAEQITVSKDMIASHGRLIDTMIEIKRITEENRVIFLRYVGKNDV